MTDLSDSETLNIAGRLVQAHELLHFHLKKKLGSEPQSFPAEHLAAVGKSGGGLEAARLLRSDLEGSSYVPAPPRLNPADVTSLQRLVSMYPAQTLPDDCRDKMKSLIVKLFEGQVESVLYACLTSNPLYGGLYKEDGQRARHNGVTVVYVSTVADIHGPYSRPSIEAASVVDLGWLHCVELGHFCSSLARGKARAVELITASNSRELIASDTWEKLREACPPRDVIRSKGLVHQCLGQAVGAAAKKSAGGHLRLKEGVSVHDFCESCRLLETAECALHHKLPPSGVESGNDRSRTIMDKLRLIVQHEEKPDGGRVSKADVLDDVVRWRAELETQLKTQMKELGTEERRVTETLGGWMLGVRLGSSTVQPLPAPGADLDLVRSVQRQVGGRAGQVTSEQVLLMARAGSYLYGLHTETSDTDYLIMYLEPTEHVLSSCTGYSECYESRGVGQEVEVGMYEARMFAEMLLKCSVVILELLFAEKLEYTSPAWLELRAKREMFVCERAVQQYWGLIRNNLRMVTSAKHAGAGRERKLFYQIFHKLSCLEALYRGEVPNIRPDGQLKQFIMDIRTQPLEGALSRDALLQGAQGRVEELQRRFAGRPGRLAEGPNPRALAEWLMRCRGLAAEP